jgi:hypothetical protein
MSWNEANRYYSALHDVVAELERTGDGVLPWRAEYAAIFGDRDGLLLALRRRWQLMVQAQVDEPYDASGQPTRELRALAQRNHGLLSVLTPGETFAPRRANRWTRLATRWVGDSA